MHIMLAKLEEGTETEKELQGLQKPRLPSTHKLYKQKIIRYSPDIWGKVTGCVLQFIHCFGLPKLISHPQFG